MLAIAADALYAAVRRRGTTRHLAAVIISCVVCALLLLPALIWFYLRFASMQAAIAPVEVGALLIYVVLWGWGLPLGVSVVYVLFAPPRARLQRGRLARTDPATPIFSLPLHPPGTAVPFVFDADTPWGWLEHCNGRFQGQRLALTRLAVTLGRGEENDIWLDDDLASRYHAELVWERGRVYVTDCNSLNGVVLNGRRIRGSAPLQSGDLLEIGTHRFRFELATPRRSADEEDDPLLRHVLRSVRQQSETAEPGLPVTPPPLRPLGQPGEEEAVLPGVAASPQVVDTAEMDTLALPQLQTPPVEAHVFLICSGPLAGRSFTCERSLLTIGRGPECEIVIDDPSLSRRHAQVLRRPDGLYVQDLVSRNGTSVNDEPLTAPRPLQAGDLIRAGSVLIQYLPVLAAPRPPQSGTAPQPQSQAAPLFRGAPLQLPMRPPDPW